METHGKYTAPLDTHLAELAGCIAFAVSPDVSLLHKLVSPLTKAAKLELAPLQPSNTPKQTKNAIHAFLMCPLPSTILRAPTVDLLAEMISKKWGNAITTTTGKVANAIGGLMRLVNGCSLKDADASTLAYLDIAQKKYGDMSAGINFARMTALTGLKEAPADVLAIVNGDTQPATECETFVAQVCIANALAPLAAHKLHDKACVMQGDHVTTTMAVHVLLQTTYGQDIATAINGSKMSATVSCQGETPPKKKVFQNPHM